MTEGCGVRALTQRLGRLNRLGRFPHAQAAYVHVPAPGTRAGRTSGTDAGTWPVYGREPAKVLERLLKSRCGSDDVTVDLSPRAVASILGPPLDDPGRAPEVLPDLLWEWTKTTTPPEGEAPVEPYFSGISAPRLTVALIWRAHVPDPGQRLWPRGTDREAIDVPLERGARGSRGRCDAPSGAGRRLRSRRCPPTACVPVTGLSSPVTGGHMDEFGWKRDASGPVADVSLANLGLAARCRRDQAGVRRRSR